MGTRIWAWPALAAAALTACSVQFPVVGRFDNNSEAFTGSVNSNLAGDAFIEVSSTAGVTCTGNSRITYKPVYSVVVPCVGQRGIAELSCSDGRRIHGDWVATGCSSGYGTGHDRDGNRFTFAMGMSEAEAARHRGDSPPTTPPAALTPGSVTPMPKPQ